MPSSVPITTSESRCRSTRRPAASAPASTRDRLRLPGRRRRPASACTACSSTPRSPTACRRAVADRLARAGFDGVDRGPVPDWLAWSLLRRSARPRRRDVPPGPAAEDRVVRELEFVLPARRVDNRALFEAVAASSVSVRSGGGGALERLPERIHRPGVRGRAVAGTCWTGRATCLRGRGGTTVPALAARRFASTAIRCSSACTRWRCTAGCGVRLPRLRLRAPLRRRALRFLPVPARRWPGRCQRGVYATRPPKALIDTLDRLFEVASSMAPGCGPGAGRPGGRAFAGMVARAAPGASVAMPAAAPMVGRWARRAWREADAGHVCVDVLGDAGGLRSAASPVVGAGRASRAPLVLDAARCTCTGCGARRRRWRGGCSRSTSGAARRRRRLAQAALAPRVPARADADDPQQRAVACALARRLTVLSGGPGTGKTTTMARLLVAFARLARSARIAYAAPTGKAAARLAQSLAAQLPAARPAGALRARLPARRTDRAPVAGAAPRRRPGRRIRPPARPRPGDRRRGVDARHRAGGATLGRGDPAERRAGARRRQDQLASVEAGAVFADLCAAALGGVVRLERNYRQAGRAGHRSRSPRRYASRGPGRAVRRHRRPPRRAVPDRERACGASSKRRSLPARRARMRGSPRARTRARCWPRYEAPRADARCAKASSASRAQRGDRRSACVGARRAAARGVVSRAGW